MLVLSASIALYV